MMINGTTRVQHSSNRRHTERIGPDTSQEIKTLQATSNKCSNPQHISRRGGLVCFWLAKGDLILLKIIPKNE